MNNNNNNNSRHHRGSHNNKNIKQCWWKLWIYISILILDFIVSLVLLTPPFPLLIPQVIANWEGQDASSGYTFHGSLFDLAILSLFRILSALFVIVSSYYYRNDGYTAAATIATTEAGEEDEVYNGGVDNNPPPTTTTKLLRHEKTRPGVPNNKSKSELEEESLEEPYWPKIKRHVHRKSFICEFICILTWILVSTKCLVRLYVEIGLFRATHPNINHPLYWFALLVTAILALIEMLYIDSIEKLTSKLGLIWQRKRRRGGGVVTPLTQPLLSREEAEEEEEDVEEVRTTNINSGEGRQQQQEEDSQQQYTAKWSDLLVVCIPDKYWILTACVFLLAASVMNVFVPKLTGEVLDALVNNANNNANNNNSTNSIMTDNNDEDDGHSNNSIPGFARNIQLLLLVSILGGIFEGVRGMIFTIVGARVNVRLRIKLFDALLSQEIGFYDTTRTGDITSRLSSDTSIVGASITNNVNMFLRSIVRATGVFIFMVFISWQLTILAFATIPTVSLLSKWYGRYIRRLMKLQQKRLAEGNSVCESSIGAMATVRAFGAEAIELNEFEICMKKYLALNQHAAIATFGFYTCIGALPDLVKSVVLFYGGLLVQSGSMTGGQLVSFILYLSNLSQAFNQLGAVYASLVRAVGAADKVFELMNRKPKLTRSSHIDQEHVRQAITSREKHILGIESTKVIEQSASGLLPDNCRGDITFKNVEFRYPSRPQRAVLKDFSMYIPAGSIVALCGRSGGGKSSIVKLIQHLYEPSAGQVFIDNHEVHELSPEFISKNVSVVPQEPTLMARSIKRNIMYGLEGRTDGDEPTQEEIEEAARLANASSFVETLPERYETEVGERGITLSAGQKQRVAIARALVRKPRILLLDESTSALDAESEHIVQTAIDDMISSQRSLDTDPSRSMTVIIIAHRLSTIRSADRIYVIDSGKVAEEGSHDELIQNENGAYSSLIRRQLGDHRIKHVSSQRQLLCS